MPRGRRVLLFEEVLTNERRMATNKMITIAIITVLVILIVAVIVSKFR